jgi:hypothetical protein
MTLEDCLTTEILVELLQNQGMVTLEKVLEQIWGIPFCWLSMLADIRSGGKWRICQLTVGSSCGPGSLGRGSSKRTRLV